MIKHDCEYCHGNTYDDSKGHCMACGAPRQMEHNRNQRVTPTKLYDTGMTSSSLTSIASGYIGYVPDCTDFWMVAYERSC